MIVDGLHRIIAFGRCGQRVSEHLNAGCHSFRKRDCDDWVPTCGTFSMTHVLSIKPRYGICFS